MRQRSERRNACLMMAASAVALNGFEMADPSVGEQAQEALDHPQARAQDRDHCDLFGQAQPAGGLERSLDLDLLDRQLAGHLDREDRCGLVERLAEHPVRSRAIAQDAQSIGEHRMVDDVHALWHAGMLPADDPVRLAIRHGARERRVQGPGR